MNSRDLPAPARPRLLQPPPPPPRIPWLWVIVFAIGLGVGARWYVDRGQAASLDAAQVLIARGGLTDLHAAVDNFLNMSSRTPCIRTAEALVRAQAAAEYDDDREGARAAIGRAEPERALCSDLAIADGLLALADGDLDAAGAAVTAPTTSLSRPGRAWLQGTLALAGRGEQAAAIAEIEATIAAQPAAIAPRRALVWLYFEAGEFGGALQTLARARTAGLAHLGLAADEALLHALLRRELSGVADLADQLLALDPAALGPRDLAHAALARALVHVHGGEPAAGLGRAAAAWPSLAPWDAHARRLALELSLEAGDAERARELLAQLGVPEPEASIVRAWSLLAEGDVMASLVALSACPQDHPRVAYLQGLALVEQRRFPEAEPWLERADRMLPGRVEVEVARARVTVHTGDVATAQRKLEGIAAAEHYAPRAYTGLGEAYLSLGADSKDLRAAQRALTRAVEKEPRPAEAMLLLGEVWQRRRLKVPEAERNALAWYEQAAAAGLRLPRYREALARYLGDLGEGARAEAMLRELSQEPGIDPTTPLDLLALALARADAQGAAVPAEADEWLAAAVKLGADADALTRARARLNLARGTGLARSASDLEKLLRRKPYDIDARILAARVLVAQRDLEAAETLVRQGFYAAEPGRDEVATGRLFIAWGEIAIKQRKRKQAALHARAGFHRMLGEQRPTIELLAAVEFATDIFLRTEQHKIALGMTRQLTEALPFHGDAWRLHARALYDEGENPKSATRAVLKALELDPDNVRALELRAHVAARAGDRTTAREALARALELETREPDRQRMREFHRRHLGE
ncbi:hypothetical protein [Nannocystis bainbridge]|uniref:Tetratricopeptide repeat protein n=1 Tax=Nannocystis bainbridge TaxID=2995303 RepID=A0ABT5E7F5_9BACT|nr:hypothetical protein [Nannocystis bainbridge]MDC0721789.1 hypothetical protein [Nannocystis bainbridge]